MTYREAFDRFVEMLLNRYDRGEAIAIVTRAFHEIANIPRADFTIKRYETLELPKMRIMEPVMTRLMNGEPLQYVIGYVEFHRHFFKVSPAVLIPRPETEELVEWILAENNRSEKLRVMDVCSGSGCIAITLKKLLAQSIVFGIELSSEALNVANENARHNHVKVEFIRKDILSSLHHRDRDFLKKQFDIIVSNPPYVPLSERRMMPDTVKEHEPAMALFVSDEDPLIFYKAILEYGRLHLAEGGRIYFEAHRDYGRQVAGLMEGAGFHDIELRRDVSGNDRMIRAIK